MFLYFMLHTCTTSARVACSTEPRPFRHLALVCVNRSRIRPYNTFPAVLA